jgi:PAS domain S-box-containing protein
MDSRSRQSRKFGLLVFHKGLILVFAPLVIEVVIISALALVLGQLDKESVTEAKYRRCAAIGAHLVVLANQAAVDVLAWFQSASPELMKQYDRAMAGIKEKEKELVDLSSQDPISRKSADDLINSVNKLTGLLDNVATLAKQKRLLDMALVIPRLDLELKAQRNTHIEHIGAVTSAQERIAEASTLRQDKLRTWQRQIIIFAIAANAAVAVLLFIFFKRGISDRLKVVRENTGCLAENRPLSQPLRGVDEIYQLDFAFHRMDADLKAAMARQRSLFENASDVICVLSPQMTFERINPACLKHWGFDPADLVGGSILQIVEEGMAERAALLFEESKLGGEKSIFELVLKRKDASALETLWSTYWSEKERLLFCVVHDISERKRIERLKQSYMAMISSDLRIPLSSIAAAAERLAGPLSGSLSPAALSRVGTVKTNLGRLLLLVNDLLEMSALESGTLKLAREVCAVEPLLRRSCHDLEGLAQKRKVRFAIETSAGDCFLDPNRIMQVIVNLASNAVKFSPEGSEVGLCARQDGDYLEVRVTDQGRGVPENQKKSIFEKFKQVEAADGRRSAGTGLGLPICKDIVAEHGGEIGVESVAGQGSTFWFRLPLSSEIFEAAVSARKAKPERISEAAAAGVDAGLEGARAPEPSAGGLRGSPKKAGRAAGSFMSLSRRGVLLILLPLAVELLFVMSILGVISQVNVSRQEELRQRQIAASAYKILNAYLKMLVLVTPSAREEFWVAYDECCRGEQTARAEMARLLRNDPEGLRQFLKEEKVSAKLDPLIAHGRVLMKENGYSNKLFDRIRPDRFVVIATISAVSKRLLVLIDEAERKQAVTPLQQARLRRQQAFILCVGLAVNILISLLLARFFSKNITTRLATLADNTSRLSASLPLNSVLPGDDEIAQLDRAFHATAEKLDEARRKERAVFDNAHDLIAALDHDFRFVSSNPAAERLLGYSQEELAGRCVLDLVDPAEKERATQLFARDSSSRESTFETRVLRSDGSAAYLLWSLSRPEGGTDIYCVAHDITDRKELEQLKHDFLSVVSHDLRSPLASVVGFATLISAGAMGEPGADAIASLNEIIAEADKLLTLINDLLDIEKLEAQGMQLILTRESAGLVAYRAFESVNPKFPEFSLVMNESNVELELDCDRERLSQAFSNVYSHICKRGRDAVRRTPAAGSQASAPNQMSAPGQGKLLLSFYARDSECVFEISDPGPPYSTDELQQLFERFKTARDAGAAVSGLALPIARRIIEAHGGSLYVKQDDRAAFIVCLNLHSRHLPPKSG